ncbi:MAG: Uma2 family endonuclease [Dehalococcoidia bacterium]
MPTHMSLDEFLALPEGEPPYSEYSRGEIHSKSPRTPPVSAVVREFITELGLYARSSREARVDTELLHAHRAEQRAYLPDVSVTRRSRFPAGQTRGAVEVPPDLAIEVLSPSDGAGYVLDKVGFYLRAGTELVWVVDPEREVVTVYRRGAEARDREARCGARRPAGTRRPSNRLGCPFPPRKRRVGAATCA